MVRSKSNARQCKYQTITFGSDIKYPDKAVNIKIGLEDIEQKDEMKLLGVLIDSDLNFSIHIAQVCRKASQQIGVLSRLKNYFLFQQNSHYSKRLPSLISRIVKKSYTLPGLWINVN